MADEALPVSATKRRKLEQSSLDSFFQKSPSKEGEKKISNAPVKTSVSEGRTSQQLTVASAAEKSGQSESIVPTQVGPPKDATWNVYKNACIYRKCQEDARGKVAAFDLDGTLLNWRIAGWPSQLEHYELWNRSVADKLRRVHDNGYKIILFTNQGAIRSAFTGKKATLIKSLVDWLANFVDRPLHCVMSTSKQSGYHKSSPKMWKVAQDCCNNGIDFDIAPSYFVGDSVGGDDDPQGGVDIDFAKNVGELAGATLLFYTPREYFGPSDAETRLDSKPLMDYEVPSNDVLQTRAALVSGYLKGPLLLMLCGVQGSGKSAFAEQVARDNAQWVHLSQDTICNGKPGRREQVEEKTVFSLKIDKSVIIDRMHLDEKQRSYFVELARSAEVPVHVIVLNPTADVILKRVRERNNHPGGVQGEAGVKLAASSIGKLVFPKLAEGFSLISASATIEGSERLAESYRKVYSSTPAGIPERMRLADYVLLPSIGLGTMGLGRKVASGVVEEAVKNGFCAADTAPTYNNEDKVGDGICDGTFCILKIPKRATNAQAIRAELTQSLSKLKRERADLLLLHWPFDADEVGTLAKVWAEIEKLKLEGLATSIGVCNFNVHALGALLTKCVTRPAVNQVERHPLLPQWELVDFCARHDIILQAHTSLGQGRKELAENEVVQEIAKKSGRAWSQVVIEWNLRQGVAVVVKCSSSEHMQQIQSVLRSGAVTGSQMKALNDIKETKRFVFPPFMAGTGLHCWGSLSASV